MLKILKDNDPVLRQQSQVVRQFDNELKKFVNDLTMCMAAHGGIGISAIQVGVPKRILVIDTRYLPHYNPKGKFMVMVNPQVILEAGNCTMREGCLSFPRKFISIDRSETVRVKYNNTNGEAITADLVGNEARVFLHELDHLNGKVFTDYE